MKVNNENFDKVLNRLVASTRSVPHEDALRQRTAGGCWKAVC